MSLIDKSVFFLFKSYLHVNKIDLTILKVSDV